MRNPHEALRAIERLVGTDFGLDMEFYLYDKRLHDKRWLKKNLRMAAKIITEIYCIAHSENSSCKHPEWEKKKVKILAKKEY